MNETNIIKDPKGAFMAALANASPGDEITYCKGITAAGPHRMDAYDASQKGLCHLKQRRLTTGTFAYIAEKAK